MTTLALLPVFGIVMVALVTILILGFRYARRYEAALTKDEST